MSIIPIKMNKTIFIIIMVFVLACHNSEKGQPVTGDGTFHRLEQHRKRTRGKHKNIEYNAIFLKGDTVFVDEKNSILQKLKFETITPVAYKKKITISGVVRAIPNNFAEVASPFAGRITKSFVRLGQHVNIDSPIFEISSPSFFEAGKAYYQSKQEMQLAEKNLKRQKDLLDNGVGIQKDVEEAEVTFELAKRDFENCLASLSVYHVKPEDLILGQPLIVRSPIQGEIVDNKIVLGQYLKEDAEPVAIVAELSKVWVAGQLKEKDIKSVHKSDDVEISLTGIPDIHFRGEVYHISEILDEETRSVQVFIECDNKDRNMKPGMYVAAQFFDSSDFSILIPVSSVLQMDDSCFVFMQLSRNKYVRRPVIIAGTDNNLAIIKSGLKAGDSIIVQGGTLLLEAR
jgi:membrane fusion protein, heavy metal efflux system